MAMTPAGRVKIQPSEFSIIPIRDGAPVVLPFHKLVKRIKTRNKRDMLRKIREN